MNLNPLGGQETKDNKFSKFQVDTSLLPRVIELKIIGQPGGNLKISGNVVY